MKKQTVLVALIAVAATVAAGDDRLDKRRDEVVRSIEKASPAVVNISTDKIIDRDFFRGWNDFFRGFDDFFRPRVAHSLGSGGILTPDGYAFTNAHVVNQASRIVVTLRDGTKYTAELVDADASNDLAVIKIDADKPLSTLTLGRSDDLLVGERVIAVGNPFGLENSVTTGIISAAKRDITDNGRILFRNVIQTDALINPGNSGGPLLNIFGEVIGVNSAIRAGAQGIGFAIPIDRVKSSMAALLDYRKRRRLDLGFEIEPKYAGPGPEETLVVANVRKDGPADSAGLRERDVVKSVDSTDVAGLVDFLAAVLTDDDSRLAVGVERDGREVTVDITPRAIPKPDAAKLAREMFGVTVQQMDSTLADHVGIRTDEGILVAGVERRSSAAGVGLRRGDIIRQINYSPVRTMEELGLVLEQLQNADSVILDFIRAEGFILMRYVAEVEVSRP
ncbi:MAG: trypsin-like peptidase domain-containing protein [Planctomycetota bacterium]|jgi:serine protease Do